MPKTFHLRPPANTFRNRLRAAWALLTLALVLSVVLLMLGGAFDAIDNAYYDRIISARDTPTPPDVAIVAIDDASLAQLGRWPWSRAVLAKAIDKLGDMGVRAIGLDLLLSDAETSAATGLSPGDEALAAALERNGKVVLPVALRVNDAGVTPITPLPAFAANAAALGHVVVDPAADGVVRGVFLQEGVRRGGVADNWPQFALALSGVSGKPLAARQSLGAGDGNAATAPRTRIDLARDNWMRIPFAGPAGRFDSVSMAALLRGEIPASRLRGRYVLIGATAASLDDPVITPTAGVARPMPSIELHANILAALLDGRGINSLSTWGVVLLSALLILLAMGAALWLPTAGGVLATLLVLALTLGGSYVLLAWGQIWFPPSAAVCGLLLGWPLWRWRRIEATLTYLGSQLDQLDREPHVLPETETGRPIAGFVRVEVDEFTDPLEARIEVVQRALRRMRAMRRFVLEDIDALPDAALIASVDGHVLIVNQRARTYFASLNQTQIDGAQLPYLLGTFKPNNAGANFSWWDVVDPDQALHPAEGIEAIDPKRRDMLVRCTPCTTDSGGVCGWLVALIDVSTLRTAERVRDETVNFLSHDIIQPSGTILHLLDVQGGANPLPAREFYANIESLARTTLSLTDNFVQLARAESETFNFETFDLSDLIQDAIDEVAAAAASKNLHVDFAYLPGEAQIVVDGNMVWRAFTNLLSHAITASPVGARVRVYTEPDPDGKTVTVCFADSGQGIAPAEQVKLLRRLQRIPGAAPLASNEAGVNLGLAFVKTVLDKHGGQLEFTSNPGRGTEFRVTIPLAPEALDVVDSAPVVHTYTHSRLSV